MDEVCTFIKTVCDDVEGSTKEKNINYIEFHGYEEQDWTNEQFINYVQLQLMSHLGTKVSNLSHLEEDDDITFKFSYDGYDGEIWEASNSRGYHYWVVSI
jgi:hypothetical protein